MFLKFSGSGNNFESAAGVLSSLDRAESTGARLIGVAGNKSHASGRAHKHTVQTLCNYSILYFYFLYIWATAKTSKRRRQSSRCSVTPRARAVGCPALLATIHKCPAPRNDQKNIIKMSNRRLGTFPALDRASKTPSCNYNLAAQGPSWIQIWTGAWPRGFRCPKSGQDPFDSKREHPASLEIRA